MADVASMFSRRWFLALNGAAVAAPRSLWTEDTVPSNLNHILLGTTDLDHGIAWVEKRTGIREESPAAQELAKQCRSLGVDASVERGEEPLLRAIIISPKAKWSLGLTSGNAG